MNGAQEVAGGFVISGFNGSVLLKSGKEILHHVAGFLQVMVVITLKPARTARWNHDSLACAPYALLAMRICAAVILRKTSAPPIMGLPGCQMKTRRIAQCIDCRVDLGVQAAKATPEGLVLFSPPFFSICPVLTGSHNGRIDHAIFIVRILRLGGKDARPHPGFFSNAGGANGSLESCQSVQADRAR